MVLSILKEWSLADYKVKESDKIQRFEKLLEEPKKEVVSPKISESPKQFVENQFPDAGEMAPIIVELPPPWDKDIQKLIDRLSSFDIRPVDSFKLSPHETIVNLPLYVYSLLMECDDGPSSPRSLFGALQKDLRNIVDYLEKNPI